MAGGAVGLQGLPAPRTDWRVLRSSTTHANMRSMTSDGHAITRLQRLLASGRGTSEQIRLLVSELPRRPDLELALAICLALLDREPTVYPRAAARWGSRFALERNLPLVDAQLTLAALAVLPGDGGRAGAEALIDLADRYGLRRVDQLLSEWIERRGLAT
jgi:hypothetical protein